MLSKLRETSCCCGDGDAPQTIPQAPHPRTSRTEYKTSQKRNCNCHESDGYQVKKQQQIGRRIYCSRFTSRPMCYAGDIRQPLKTLLEIPRNCHCLDAPSPTRLFRFARNRKDNSTTVQLVLPYVLQILKYSPGLTSAARAAPRLRHPPMLGHSTSGKHTLVMETRTVDRRCGSERPGAAQFCLWLFWQHGTTNIFRTYGDSTKM